MPNPLLLNIPEQFETERLLIRVPREGDGAMMNAAVNASHSILKPHMLWAQELQTLEESELYCRTAYSDFVARKNLPMMLIRKSDGVMVGNSGLHHLDWSVPSFEIGYWAHIDHQGQGYITEATIGITEFAFTTLSAARVELRCDTRNTASASVAKRAGFTLCGTFHKDYRFGEGDLRDTFIFEKLPPTN